jgi:energy-coupling factor transporter transmembrane protein EcfT
MSGETAQNRKKTLFGYIPAESWVYKLHPTTRLLIMVVFAFMPLAILTTEINIVLVGLWIVALLSANVWIGRLKYFMPLIITMFLFMMGTYLIFPGQTSGPVAFRWGPFVGYFEPLMFAFANYWRIVALVFAAIFYATTNRERDIIVGLRELGLSFGVVYVLSLAFRSAGMFLDDLSTIREAEHAKGMDTDGMSVSDRVKHYVMYIVPLFSLAIRRVTDIEDALFARGFHHFSFGIREKRRPNYLSKKYTLKWFDYAIIGVLVVGSVALFYLSIFEGRFNVQEGYVYEFLYRTVVET